MDEDIVIIGLCQRCGKQYIKGSIYELHDCSVIREPLGPKSVTDEIPSKHTP